MDGSGLLGVQARGWNVLFCPMVGAMLSGGTSGVSLKVLFTFSRNVVLPASVKEVVSYRVQCGARLGRLPLGRARDRVECDDRVEHPCGGGTYRRCRVPLRISKQPTACQMQDTSSTCPILVNVLIRTENSCFWVRWWMKPLMSRYL